MKNNAFWTLASYFGGFAGSFVVTVLAITIGFLIENIYLRDFVIYFSSLISSLVLVIFLLTKQKKLLAFSVLAGFFSFYALFWIMISHYVLMTCDYYFFKLLNNCLY